MELMQEIKHVLKEGVVNGPALYLTQKLVLSTDIMSQNFLKNSAGAQILPQMVRTPLVGLVLGTLPLMMSDHWLAEKISEYSMANAVAQTLTVGGSPNGVTSGPLNTTVNGFFQSIANIGATVSGPPSPPAAGTAGYMRRASAGYMAPRATGAYARAGKESLTRPRNLRGLTTEWGG
jgi:hypothetical protein